MPLVYDKEFTGADVKKPALPAFSELPAISHLPDPFLMADGQRITSKDEWRVRRAEIKALLEQYDVGEGENTFEMTATINRPAGVQTGPIPAIIGMNSPTGSLPREVFAQRGIATITYRGAQVAPTGFGGVNYASGNFMKLYPNATAGFMSAGPGV